MNSYAQRISGFGGNNPIDPHIDIGNDDQILKIFIWWPSGIIQTVSNPPINHEMTILVIDCQANNSTSCHAAIHFARFEEPFLRDLHRKNSPESEFPFETICTHGVMKRLLPRIPRKGIRPVPKPTKSVPRILPCALKMME